jgi:tRNA nucleotidyltransferase (CCA-adding enzyme)
MHLIDYFRNNARVDLYVVGGYVRDHLLNLENKDIDFVTTENLNKFINRLRKSYPDLVGKVIMYKKYKVANIKFSIDVTSYSVDIGNFRGNFYEDTVRRDFTINSIYVELFPANWIFHDLSNGMVDLRKRLLVPHSNTSFIEDPIRLIRGIRFAVRYDMKLSSLFLDCISIDHYKQLTNFKKYKEFEKCCSESPYHIPLIIFRTMVILGFSDHAVKLMGNCDSPEIIKNKLRQTLTSEITEQLFGFK